MKDWILIALLLVLAWTGWIVPVVIGAGYLAMFVCLVMAVCNLEESGR